MPQPVCHVDGKTDLLGDGAGNSRKECVHVLLRVTGRNLDRLRSAPIFERRCEQWPAILLRRRGAECQHPIRALRPRQQVEQGDGREPGAGMPVFERVPRRFRVGTQDSKQNVLLRHRRSVAQLVRAPWTSRYVVHVAHFQWLVHPSA